MKLGVLSMPFHIDSTDGTFAGVRRPGTPFEEEVWVLVFSLRAGHWDRSGATPASSTSCYLLPQGCGDNGTDHLDAAVDNDLLLGG